MSDVEDAVRPPPPRLCDYAADVTAERLDRMLSHIEGVRKAEDATPVHQMRVWSRRSRAALEVFRVCFAGKAFTLLEREVKTAADALSEARDLDVMVENLRKRAASLPEKQRAGIDRIVRRLTDDRVARQKAVEKAVTALESRNLAQRFREIAGVCAGKTAHGRDAVELVPNAAPRGNGKRGSRG